MSDFENAKFYALEDEDTLTCETPEEVISRMVGDIGELGETVEHICARIGPITIFAHNPDVIEFGWFDALAERIIDFIEEQDDDEHSGDERRRHTESETAELKATLIDALKKYIDGDSYWCHVVGKRTYSAEEILQICKDDGE